ncbi:hypothetical protein MPTK1_1g27180 [Marchantia polymorpha subsp. ruderalis]|uniref:Uncharacterized protein n=2 Tax=Marchantia polymorpha TaxID=3197 RepID=A0AAF6AUS5_MARPO|nr:hypothetical protein MARPO_0002s0160 [Marchantia polymorpha]BBN00196.1 hypothetical protein Mp_1g27180 [Marchantia polymorpha subsp. ruderalis]|eukprot:PTQ49688.1 hypothetical protein MARPO_0002s0160 [Marchantia polymorpha]
MLLTSATESTHVRPMLRAMADRDCWQSVSPSVARFLYSHRFHHSPLPKCSSPGLKILRHLLQQLFEE